MAEKMGNPSKDEGEWIAKIDLVESGKALKLEEQEQLGEVRGRVQDCPEGCGGYLG